MVAAALIMPRHVFPTRVGVNRVLVTLVILDYSIPHTRGGEPPSASLLADAPPYSPHAWG